MDPDLELQGAIVSRLKADAGVTALVSDRVYDRVPEFPQFPYISYGPADTLSLDSECITGFSISVLIDVWSREVGYPECKRINNAVREALHDVDMELPVNALVFIQHRTTRTFRDPDGLTNHGSLLFEASIEKGN
jgi:hypothetical protein